MLEKSYKYLPNTPEYKSENSNTSWTSSIAYNNRATVRGGMRWVGWGGGVSKQMETHANGYFLTNIYFKEYATGLYISLFSRYVEACFLSNLGLRFVCSYFDLLGAFL